MSHVFISYKHDDAIFADMLREKLEAEELNTWADTDIRPGEQWKQAIDEAIKSSFAVVVILSPEAHASPYVTYEWSYAMGIGRPVVPILLRKTEIHPKLQDIQHLSFVGRNAPYKELIQQLTNLRKVSRPITSVTQTIWEPAELQPIIDDLDDYSASTREAAAITLGDLGIQEAIPNLINRFQDKEIRVVLVSIRAVGLIGSEKAIPALLNLLNRQNLRQDVHFEACRALARIGGSIAFQQLIRILSAKGMYKNRSNAGLSLTESVIRLGIENVPATVIKAVQTFCKEHFAELEGAFRRFELELIRLEDSEWYIDYKKERDFEVLSSELETIASIAYELDLVNECTTCKSAHQQCQTELAKHIVPF